MAPGKETAKNNRLSLDKLETPRGPYKGMVGPVDLGQPTVGRPVRGTVGKAADDL